MQPAPITISTGIGIGTGVTAPATKRPLRPRQTATRSQQQPEIPDTVQIDENVAAVEYDFPDKTVRQSQQQVGGAGVPLIPQSNSVSSLVSLDSDSGTASRLTSQQQQQQQQKQLSPKEAVFQIIALDKEKKVHQEAIKKICNDSKRCEKRLVHYMQNNNIIKIGVTESDFLELKQREIKEKPNGKIMLERLKAQLNNGNVDAESVFKIMFAPVKTKKEAMLSKRKRRRPNPNGGNGGGSANGSGNKKTSAVPTAPAART